MQWMEAFMPALWAVSKSSFISSWVNTSMPDVEGPSAYGSQSGAVPAPNEQSPNSLRGPILNKVQ